ncbi:MAG: DUF4157 domain-containing protein, partial [Thermoanaerobaculia bacterium]
QAKRVQERVQENAEGVPVAPPLVDEVLRTSGQPLDPPTRDFMELRFDHDFSQVRLHTDAQAVQSAQEVHARAYTVGQDIAFGKSQYSPQTLEGRRLLAHELTHVLHQTGGGAPALQRSVVTSGCDELPFDKQKVEEAATRTFNDIKASDCIKNQSLREDVLDKLGSLKIVCHQGGKEGPCSRADRPRTVHLYEAINKTALCPSPMDPAIFHEAIHLTEWFSLYHGNLSWDCGEACYPGTDERKRGDASKCAFERSPLPFAGIAKGRAFTGKGNEASYFRLYVGLEKRRPILSVVDASLGIGASFIGEPEAGEPGTAPSGKSTLISLIGALRFDPGKMGHLYASASGGLGVGFSNDKAAPGAVVGLGVGYRWRMLDFSLNAGIDYNPTRNLGEEKMYTVSASLSFAQKVRP